MAGGTWSNQNKIQPGIYINVRSNKAEKSSIGARGTVSICEPLSWGPENTIIEIQPGDNYENAIGYDETNEKALFIREIFTGTDHTTAPTKILLYRPSGTGGVAATATIGSMTITAKYKGIRGNDIKIAISETGESDNSYIVQTFVDEMIKDSQTVTDVKQLVDNDWVSFQGNSLTASAGIALIGGKDGVIASADYAQYLATIESCKPNIIIYDGDDAIVKSAFVSFVKRMRSIGINTQVVMANMQADSELVISVKNGYCLKDGTTLPAQKATWWVGGAQAGAAYNESLVYAKHPNAQASVPRLTPTQIDQAIEQGNIVFIEEAGKVKVVSDINTLVSLTTEKGEVFRFNQVVRITDTIKTDIHTYFSNNYIGKLQNNEDNRQLLRGWIVEYLKGMQANGAIQNFDTEDVVVSVGNNINAVVIEIAIQPVVAIEKIFITLSLTGE